MESKEKGSAGSRMGKTFRIVTLGCKVNQYESAHFRERLLREGCHEPQGNERADITIINTCIVTQRAAYQSRQAIRKAVRENPSGLTAAVGCYAQVYPEELSKIEGLRLVAGNTVKGRLHEILLEGGAGTGCVHISEDFSQGMTFEFLPIRAFQDRTRAFLKIQDGCEAFCSYCIVPSARGPSRSLDPFMVLFMLKTLAEEGYQEVVLTGIHLGKYGADFREEMTLSALLRLIGKEGLPIRIRLSSIEPYEVHGELIELVASEGWLCRHFHIPLQSGDRAVLKRMNRHYTDREFSALVEQIHKEIPLAAIGVDVMVGFPGEDEAAYQNSLSFIRELPVSYLHVFPFSPRKGTAAAGLSGRVNEKVQKERAVALRVLGQEKREAFYRSCVGEEFRVLAEGWHSAREKRVKGLSDNYLPILFSSGEELKNRLVLTRAEKVVEGAVIGTLIEVLSPGPDVRVRS